jgi:hypothetical protein
MTKEDKPKGIIAFMVVFDTATQTPIYMGTVDKPSAITVLNHLIAKEQAEKMVKAMSGNGDKPKGKKSRKP